MDQMKANSSSSPHTLVTQTLVDTSKYYCPFLDRGFCRETSSCNFSHENRNSTRIPTDYCYFYLANQCLHGQDCKFLHSEPTDDGNKDLPLCSYFLASGECPFPVGHCNYLHRETCDLCYTPCLHPFNETQRRQHRDDCLRKHEREMELSFAIQRSKDKVCGICMDIVVEKIPITACRFGILEKCNHIFCLECIRKWRGTKQFDSRTIRACPECRISSDFVVPSKYWVEDQSDKDKLIGVYKRALASKPCRYFKEGKGDCPFADSCFYKHAYPDGSTVTLGPPKPRRRFYRAREPTSVTSHYIIWSMLTSTDEDELSNDDTESRSSSPPSIPYYTEYAEDSVSDYDDYYDRHNQIR